MNLSELQEEIAVFLNFKYGEQIWNKMAEFQKEPWLKDANQLILGLKDKANELGKPIMIVPDGWELKLPKNPFIHYINHQKQLVRKGKCLGYQQAQQEFLKSINEQVEVIKE